MIGFKEKKGLAKKQDKENKRKEKRKMNGKAKYWNKSNMSVSKLTEL
jgi:hypothetical protein